MEKTFLSYRFGKTLDQPVTQTRIMRSDNDTEYVVFDFIYTTDTFRQDDSWVVLFRDPDLTKCIDFFVKHSWRKKDVTC
jgi:hypothetical protein